MILFFLLHKWEHCHAPGNRQWKRENVAYFSVVCDDARERQKESKIEREGEKKTVATQERFGATLLFHCVRFTDHIMQLHIRINAIRNCLSTV